MYEKYLEQLEEAGKIRNLKERSINCYKNYVSYFLKYQNKNPEELTCQDVRIFLLAKKEEGLKATTLNLYNSAVFALPSGNRIFAATPTERITHYTLQAKSCAKGCPFGNP